MALPQDSLLPAAPVAAEVPAGDALIPRADLQLMLSGNFSLIRVPRGHSWMVKPKVTQGMTQLMTGSGLADPQRWYDLLASCGLSANLYVMDGHGERYKVIDVEIDPGGETGELILQHLGRRSRQGYMRVDIQDGYGRMLPFVVYKEQHSRRNPESRPSSDSFRIYKIFVILALFGLLRESDELMRKHRATIRKVAKYLRKHHPITLVKLYRGLLIPPSDVPADRIARPYEDVQSVSFTENLQVACWFASTEATMSDVVMLQKPKATGWVGESSPTEGQILFHYSWIEPLRHGPGPDIYQLALDMQPQLGLEDAVMQFRYHAMHQKEVICESNITYPLKPISDYRCDSARELDNRFIPRGDFIVAPAGLEQFHVKAGQRLPIERAEFHRPHRRCMQCRQASILSTYHLKGVPFNMDTCENCRYLFYLA
jgi:hypothetical protein